MKPLFQVLLVVVLSILLVSAVAAQTGSPSAPPTPSVEKLAPGEFLLTVAHPDTAKLEVQSGLDRTAAEELARAAIRREAGSLIAELEARQTRGEIAAFEFRPDLGGVVVQAAAGQSASLMSAPGVQSLTEGGQQPPACAAASVAALTEELLARSRAAGGRTSAAPDATNPSISLYVPRSGTDWSSISGQTSPDVAVTARILRGNRVIGEPSTTSYSDGWYYLYPSWYSCPSSGYNWTIQPGDVVAVTAGGRTVSTVAVGFANLSMDPLTNRVSGHTVPGRRVVVDVYQYDANPCWSSATQSQGMPNAAGDFSIDHSSVLDFRRDSWARVRSVDSQGNDSYNYTDAYRIYCRLGSSSCTGLLAPNTAFEATVQRDGYLIASSYGRSNASGYFGFYTGDTLRAGDVVRVNGGNHTIHFVAASWTGELDPTTDRVFGQTAPGRRVRANFERNNNSSTMGTCNSSYYCASAVAAADGSVSVYSPGNVERGDYAYVYLYDSDGNYEYSDRYPASAIYARLSWNSIQGFWRRLGGTLGMTVRDQFNSPLSFVSPIQPSSYDGNYYANPGVTLQPGYRIEVTDGQSTDVMTVSELTARAQDDGQRLEGSSAAGHLLAYWWDFRSESAGWWSQCRETDHPGGGYQFTGMPVSGQDEGYVRLRGADGHYTERYARAFSVAINKDEPYMWGYTELPYASATVGLTRGGVVLGAWNPSSYSDGYFSVSLPSPLVFQAGDVVSVTTSDGDSAQVTVPPLTVSEDAARNELTGIAPAGKPVIADLVRVYGTRESGYTSYSMASRATAGADGRYRASFANMWWQRNNQCYAADVGHRCAYGNVRYYAPGDHRVSLSGPFPAPVSADSFEFDDNPANARPAGPMQYHTFHVQSDPDWVRITVPQSDVDRGVLYRLMTRNLGWGVDTVIELYASDGETLLAWNDDFPYPASRIDWRPQSAGVYYLKARPFSSWYGGAAHCDASYDLVVLPIRGTVLLPIQSK